MRMALTKAAKTELVSAVHNVQIIVSILWIPTICKLHNPGRNWMSSAGNGDYRLSECFRRLWGRYKDPSLTVNMGFLRGLWKLHLPRLRFKVPHSRTIIPKSHQKIFHWFAHRTSLVRSSNSIPIRSFDSAQFAQLSHLKCLTENYLNKIKYTII